MHAGMNGEAAHRYKTIQAIEATILMHDLLKEDLPMARYSHFRRCVPSTCIRVVVYMN